MDSTSSAANQVVRIFRISKRTDCRAFLLLARPRNRALGWVACPCAAVRRAFDQSDKGCTAAERLRLRRLQFRSIVLCKLRIG